MAANYERMLSIGRFAGQEPAVHTWGTKALPFESVTATDKLTLQIKLSRPNADTHRQLFDDCHVRAYPPETFDMLGNVNNLIGTGPFIVNEYVSGSSVTFDRNPDYWKDDEKYPGNRLPYADKLVMLMMADEATRLAALRSGQIDITGETGVSRIKSIANAVQLQEDVAGIQLFPIALRSETSLSMRMDKPPLNDIRVRHALQMALDNETIRDTYFYGFGEWKAQGPIGPLWVGYHNAFDTWPEELQGYYSYDPEGAERLLDEADYPRGADGVRFRTSMWQNAARSDIGYHELQVGYWKKIGVEVELNVLDNATLLGKMNSGDWEGMTGWWNAGADYSQLDSGIGSYRSDGPVWGAYNDSVFDAKWQEVVAASSDENEYRRLAKKLDLYVLEQHFYIWGVKVPTFNVAQPWIVGYNGEMGIGNCGWEGPYNRLWIDSELKDELN
jgi:peptide/nickel transport system substrate-binding protein